VPTSKIQTYWPDGQLKDAPKDGFVYFQGNLTYTWDGFLESWSDSRGNIIDFDPANVMLRLAPLPVTLRIFVNGLPLREDDELEEKLVAYTSPSCECGAKAVGSSKHSDWCQLYDRGKL